MTCRIVASLAEIAGGYEAVFCDLWGVYHDGITPYPQAVAALRAYRARGGIVVLLTNAPRGARAVQGFLDKIGAPGDSHDGIMSSGIACQRALLDGSHGRRFHYVGPTRDLDLMGDLGLDPVPLAEAEAVLCTGLVDDRVETPADYAGAMAEWLARGLPMLCANPDIVVDRGETRLWCAGALARDYASLGGAVTWFGKPHLPIYDQARALLDQIAGRPVAPGAILAIGDGPATDLAGAAAAGIDALFVTAGIAADEVGAEPEPVRLAAGLARLGVAPAYAIGRLR